MKTGIIRLTVGLLMSMMLAGVMPGTAAAAEIPEQTAAVPAITIAETGISQEEALQIVLEDSMADSANAVFSKLVNEFSDGRSLYEIDFIVPGENKYEYKVDALSGELLEHETEPWTAEDDMKYQPLLEEDQTVFRGGSVPSDELIQKSAAAAIEKAGAREDAVYYYKAGLIYENGRLIYEIGFLLPGEWKSDCDIDLQTGEIIAQEQDPWTAEDDLEYQGLTRADTPEADPAPADPPAAPAGELSADQAVMLAVQDAGFAINDVAVVKNARENDDGLDIYDISFYGPDGFEYDYEISAADGTIIEKDIDLDD